MLFYFLYYSTVSLWDGKDGACLKYVYNKKGHTEIKVVCVCGCVFTTCKPILLSTLAAINSHTHTLQSCSRARYNETLIALYGQYSEVYILDSNSLEASDTDWPIVHTVALLCTHYYY